MVKYGAISFYNKIKKWRIIFMKGKQLRKRVAAIGMSLVLAVGILSVKVSPVTARAAAKEFKFTYKKATVQIGGAAKKLIKKAGKPIKKTAKKSCAYKGKDRTYKYKDFILYTYSNSDNGPEYVNGITFLTSKVSTKEGIRIGSAYSSVKSKYGKGKDVFGIYVFKKGKSKLQIEVADDKVKNLRYIKAK